LRPAKTVKKVTVEELQGQIKTAGQVLHDHVAPLLIGAGLQLQIVRMDNPDLTTQVNEVLSTLDDAMERVRQLSQELAPSPFTPEASEE
jgi:signal transduction histidine kinase